MIDYLVTAASTNTFMEDPESTDLESAVVWFMEPLATFVFESGIDLVAELDMDGDGVITEVDFEAALMEECMMGGYYDYGYYGYYDYGYYVYYDYYDYGYYGDYDYGYYGYYDYGYYDYGYYGYYDYGYYGYYDYGYYDYGYYSYGYDYGYYSYGYDYGEGICVAQCWADCAAPEADGMECWEVEDACEYNTYITPGDCTANPICQWSDCE